MFHSTSTYENHHNRQVMFLNRNKTNTNHGNAMSRLLISTSPGAYMRHVYILLGLMWNSGSQSAELLGQL